MKHLMESFCMASMGAAKEAPRNIAREAGRAGRNTAGNWCGEEEECLSTKPTQTQASSLNLLFTHNHWAHSSLTSAAHPNLNSSFGFTWDVFQDSLHFIYQRSNTTRQTQTEYSLLCKQDWAANDSSTELTDQHPYDHSACLT